MDALVDASAQTQKATSAHKCSYHQCCATQLAAPHLYLHQHDWMQICLLVRISSHISSILTTSISRSVTPKRSSASTRFKPKLVCTFELVQVCSTKETLSANTFELINWCACLNWCRSAAPRRSSAPTRVRPCLWRSSTTTRTSRSVGSAAACQADGQACRAKRVYVGGMMGLGAQGLPRWWRIPITARNSRWVGGWLSMIICEGFPAMVSFLQQRSSYLPA